jgi:hypothetical protein
VLEILGAHPGPVLDGGDGTGVSLAPGARPRASGGYLCVLKTEKSSTGILCIC